MDKIETYIDKIVSQLNCDEEEKRDLIDEMRDHLYLLKGEYIELGFTHKEATQKAIESFGEQKQLINWYKESLNPFYKLFKRATWTVFCLYSAVVLFKLIFQRIIMRVLDYKRLGYGHNSYFLSPPDSKGFFDLKVWQLNSNIIPFQSIINYINFTNTPYLSNVLSNTLGNVLIFLPLGFFLPILFEKYKLTSRVFIASIMLSLSIEILQFVLQLGQFDIDDIILNVIGSMTGFSITKIIYRMTKLTKKNKLQRTTN